MGKRGPRPLPAAVLERRGSWRANQARENAPVPPEGAPKQPGWLPPRSKKYWKPAIAILEHMGVVTKAEEVLVGRYCETIALWREMGAYIAKNGSTGESYNKNGDPVKKKRPEAELYLAYSKQLLDIERELGLTPSARTRIAAKARPENFDEITNDRAFIRTTTS